MKRQIVNKDVFVSRFKECFEQSGETTYSLAEKTSLTAATISRYLNGIIVPKVTTLYAFADIFKVNPAWLIGYDAPKQISYSQKKPSTENGKGLDKNTVVIVGRDGRRIEKKLSDDQIKALEMMIEQLPPFEL